MYLLLWKMRPWVTKIVFLFNSLLKSIIEKNNIFTSLIKTMSVFLIALNSLKYVKIDIGKSIPKNLKVLCLLMSTLFIVYFSDTLELTLVPEKISISYFLSKYLFRLNKKFSTPPLAG